MNAAAGTTSSRERSKGARGARSMAMSIGVLLRRIDQRPFHGDLYTDRIAEGKGCRRANVQHRAGRSHDVNQRIAATVFDVLDAALDRIDAVRTPAHGDLFRPDRDARAPT